MASEVTSLGSPIASLIAPTDQVGRAFHIGLGRMSKRCANLAIVC